MVKNPTEIEKALRLTLFSRYALETVYGVPKGILRQFVKPFLYLLDNKLINPFLNGEGDIVKCPKCKEEIAEGASKCKHCGADLRNWFMRHKFITGFLVLIIVIIGLSSLGGKSSSSSSSSSSTSSSSSQKEYKVGDKIQLSNHELIVNSVNKNYQTGNEFEKPQDTNNVFVTVNVTITNTGDDNSLAVNEFGFKLEDQTGTQRDFALAIVQNPLQSVTLSKGGTTTGNLIYEAKANSTTLKLHYSGGMFGGGEIIVNL